MLPVMLNFMNLLALTSAGSELLLESNFMAMFFKLTLQPAKYFRRVVSRQSSQTEFAQAIYSFSGSRPEVTAQLADLFFELTE